MTYAQMPAAAKVFTTPITNPRLEAQAEPVHGGDGRQDHRPRPGAHVRQARATATKWRRREPARRLHPHLSGVTAASCFNRLSSPGSCFDVHSHNSQKPLTTCST